MSQANHKPFYDLEKVKSIPIIEVCNKFGIALERKGGSIWCKLRPENLASTKLYLESNTFYDFGTNQKGDTIGLVSTFQGVDRGEAIRQIANAFCVAPENPRSGLSSAELTVWEYEKIGLDGKMATRNFDFDLSRQDINRVSELSLRYAMPMNVLKKNNPRIYERLLKQRAIPHIRELRRDYYMEIFAKYNLSKAVGSEDVFYRAAESGEFADMIKELQTAEMILERACKGTQISAWPVGSYDPAVDIKKILSGEVKLTLGNASYQELKTKAEQEKTAVKYRTVDFSGFLSSSTSLGTFAHSAFLKDGNVVVGYLEKDHMQIKPLLDKIRLPSKGNLNQKIAQAKQQSSQQSSDSYRNGAQSKNNSKGEER